MHKVVKIALSLVCFFVLCIPLMYGGFYVAYRNDDPWKHSLISKNYSEHRFSLLQCGMTKKQAIGIMGTGLPSPLWHKRAAFRYPEDRLLVYVAPNTSNYDVPYVWRYVVIGDDGKIEHISSSCNDVGYLDWIEGWMETHFP